MFDISRNTRDNTLLDNGMTIQQPASESEIRNITGHLFKKNKYGHYSFTITGINYSGNGEIISFTPHHYTEYVELVMTSNEPDSYDINHILEKGVPCNIVLVPSEDISVNESLTILNVQNYVLNKFHYHMPKAGIVPRMLELISDKEMAQMGFNYIATPHNPIRNHHGVGNLRVLTLAKVHCHVRVMACLCGNFQEYWPKNGAFAFTY